MEVMRQHILTLKLLTTEDSNRHGGTQTEQDGNIFLMALLRTLLFTIDTMESPKNAVEVLC